MVPYYSPNFHLKDVVKALFLSRSEQKVRDYYSQYSGKRYVLITSSCRSALYLAYKSLNKNGKVFVSPLVCSVALQPICEAGNEIAFIDVSKVSFNMDLKLLPDCPKQDVFAIQSTYLGGRPMDMDVLIEYKNKHNLLLIEDCAQGFGSKFKNENLGSFGDIACFSMVKTGYGISGGVLATNDKIVYERAVQIQNGFRKSGIVLTAFRCVRNIAESNRSSKLGSFIYDKLMSLRPENKTSVSFSSALTKPSSFAISVFSSRINILNELHKQRVKAAKMIVDRLPKTFRSNYDSDDLFNMVPAKLFFTGDRINSKIDVKKLNQQGVEAKHLQQKYHAYYQDSLENDLWQSAIVASLPNYFSVHDHLLSIPLFEELKMKQVLMIIKTINYV